MTFRQKIREYDDKIEAMDKALLGKAKASEKFVEKVDNIENAENRIQIGNQANYLDIVGELRRKKKYIEDNYGNVLDTEIPKKLDV